MKPCRTVKKIKFKDQVHKMLSIVPGTQQAHQNDIVALVEITSGKNDYILGSEHSHKLI